MLVRLGFCWRHNIKYLINFSVEDSVNVVFQELKDPGVKTFCLYGLNEKYNTPALFDYRKSTKDPWYDAQPETIDGPGDGTVNEKSLKACHKWKDTTVAEFDNVEHLDILADLRVLDYIENILSKL